MTRARLPTQHICVGSHVLISTVHSRSVCITIKCYFFPLFSKELFVPNRSGFFAIKGPYPKPPPLFVFRLTRAQKWTPAYEANHQKSVILSLLVPTSITKMPAPERNLPPGDFSFLKIICAGTSCFRSVRPSFGPRLKSSALASSLPMLG